MPGQKKLRTPAFVKMFYVHLQSICTKAVSPGIEINGHFNSYFLVNTLRTNKFIGIFLSIGES